MKKSNFLFAIIFVIAISSASTISIIENYSTQEKLSEITLKNIEALSRTELIKPGNEWGYKATSYPCPEPVSYKKAIVCEEGSGSEYNQRHCLDSDC